MIINTVKRSQYKWTNESKAVLSVLAFSKYASGLYITKTYMTLALWKNDENDL